MDQGISIEPTSRVLRLALAVIGAVFGLLVLSVAFGSSTASADDGAGESDSLGSAVGGLVSSVTHPVGSTVTAVTHAVAPAVTPVTHAVAQAPVVAPVAKPVTDAVAEVVQAAPVASVTAPIAGLADGAITKLLGGTALGDAVGPTPVGSILAPVADLADGAAADAGESVLVPVLGIVAEGIESGPVVAVTAVAPAALASTAALDVVVGVASGRLALDPTALTGTGTDGSVGLTSAGAPLVAAVAAGAFFALLTLRRTTLVSRKLPGSPVYDTDSSPD